METNAIKWHMLNGGCNVDSTKKYPLFRANHSFCHSMEGGLDAPTIVEQFTLQAPDGSEFLISITKLKKEHE